MAIKSILHSCMYVILSPFEYVVMHLVIITSFNNTFYIQKIQFIMTKGTFSHSFYNTTTDFSSGLFCVSIVVKNTFLATIEMII